MIQEIIKILLTNYYFNYLLLFINDKYFKTSLICGDLAKDFFFSLTLLILFFLNAIIGDFFSDSLELILILRKEIVSIESISTAFFLFMNNQILIMSLSILRSF